MLQFSYGKTSVGISDKLYNNRLYYRKNQRRIKIKNSIKNSIKIKKTNDAFLELWFLILIEFLIIHVLILKFFLNKNELF